MLRVGQILTRSVKRRPLSLRFSIRESCNAFCRVADLTNLDSETTHSLDSMFSKDECKDGDIGDSRANQDSENPPVASPAET